MNKTQLIMKLRDEFNLSWYQIAKIVYGSGDSRTQLKVYGLYHKAKNSRSTNNVIVTTSGIVSSIDLYVKSKVHESHEPMFIGDLQKERIELARQLKHLKREDPRRQEIYKKINEIKLLELLIIIYDLIGLAEYDKERMYLQLIYSIGRKLVKRIDLSKDRVKWSRKGIDHLSEEAAAFLYIVYFAALYNTQYQRFLDKIREIVYSLIKGRNREKKIQRIHKIIREKYSDVLSNIILRL